MLDILSFLVFGCLFLGFLYCVFALCGINFFFEILFNFLKNAVFQPLRTSNSHPFPVISPQIQKYPIFK